MMPRSASTTLVRTTAAVESKVKHKHRPKLSGQKQIREDAVKYFFPKESLAESKAGSVLYINQNKNFVAHVSVGQQQKERLKKSEPRFWFGLRINHLRQISEAGVAFFVACGHLSNGEMVRFSFPLTIKNGVPHLCDYPLSNPVTTGSGNHYIVHLNYINDRWVLDLSGKLIDADAFAIPRVMVQSHYRSYPVAPPTQENLHQKALPTTIEAYNLIQSVAGDLVSTVNQNDPTVKIVIKLEPV